MARQPRPRRLAVTRYYAPDGRRCARGTPGAVARKEQTATWYATIPGEGRVSLGTADEGAAWQELRRRLRDRELRAAGVRDSYTDAAAEPVESLAVAWLGHMAARGASAGHRAGYRAMLLRLARLAGWRALAGVDADSCRRALAALPVGAGTRRNYLAAARAFARWCVATGRLAADPLAGLPAPDAARDVRRERRLAKPEELASLFSYLASPAAKVRRKTSPAARALAYKLALYCGLRAGEVSRLKADCFDFTACTVTVAASSDKRRRRAVLPVPAWLAAELRAHIEGGGGLWGRLTHRTAAEVLAADLAACGVPYRTEGPDGPLYLDFHSLRYWYITMLSHQPGISPKVMLELARHSDPRLTLVTYARAQQAQSRAAAEGLPRV